MKRILILAVLFFVVSIRPAAAYLDPGAGSYIWQIVAGSLLGIIFMAKSYGTVFKAKITQLTKSKASTDETKDDQTA